MKSRSIGAAGALVLEPPELVPAVGLAEEEVLVSVADAAGAGVTLLDGKLVERLHVAAAQRLIALAEAIAQR
jgi:citrate lyase subunit beta/citryl-CoA lyase